VLTWQGPLQIALIRWSRPNRLALQTKA